MATVNKLLHPTMMALKNASEQDGGDAPLVATAQLLFGVDGHPPVEVAPDPAPASVMEPDDVREDNLSAGIARKRESAK